MAWQKGENHIKRKREMAKGVSRFRLPTKRRALNIKQVVDTALHDLPLSPLPKTAGTRITPSYPSW
jgi:hypothetical protein